MTVSLFDPRTLAEIVRLMPPTRTFFRDTFFGNRKPFDTEKVDVDFYKGRRQLAPFVNVRIAGKVIEERGFKTLTYEPPHINPMKVTTADHILKRRMGEPLYGGQSPTQRAAAKVGEDFAEMDEMITRREEWMCAQTILTGKIPLKGEGVDYEIDFGFTNKETLSGTDLWSNEASDPIAYIEQASLKCQQEGYRTPNVCIMANDVATAFLNHPKVRALLDIQRIEYAILAPKELPENVRYIGTIPKLNLSFYEYNEWYLDDWTNPAEPAEKPLVPAGTLVLASSNARFSIYYGAVILVDESTKEFVTLEGTRVPDSWITKNPAQRFLRLTSRPLPVAHEVDSWFVAKVL